MLRYGLSLGLAVAALLVPGRAWAAGDYKDGHRVVITFSPADDVALGTHVKAGRRCLGTTFTREMIKCFCFQKFGQP